MRLFFQSFLLYFIVSIRPLFFLHNMPTLLRSTAQTQSFFLPYRRCFNSALSLSLSLSLSLFRLIISHLTFRVVTALIVTEMPYSAINHSFCCHHHHHDHHHHHHHHHPLFICLFIYLFIFISILLFNAKKTRQINTNSRRFSCFLRSAHLHLQIRLWDYNPSLGSRMWRSRFFL